MIVCIAYVQTGIGPKAYFVDPSNTFDAVIVVLSYVDIAIGTPPYSLYADTHFTRDRDCSDPHYSV